HLAPGVNNLRMAPGTALVVVPAALVSGQYVALSFYGPRPQQHLPVRFAGSVGKGRRYADDLGPLLAQALKQAGKTQVVADCQPELPHRGVDHNDFIPRGKAFGFAIAVVSVADIGIEQVNFVVT